MAKLDSSLPILEIPGCKSIPAHRQHLAGFESQTFSPNGKKLLDQISWVTAAASGITLFCLLLLCKFLCRGQHHLNIIVLAS